MENTKKVTLNSLNGLIFQNDLSIDLGQVIVYKDNSYKKANYETTKEKHTFNVSINVSNENIKDFILYLLTASNSAKVKIQNIIRQSYSDSVIESLKDNEKSLMYDFNELFQPVRRKKSTIETAESLTKKMNLNDIEKLQKMIAEQKAALLAQSQN